MNKTSKVKSVSIIIPTYNEKDNIIPLVERINNSLHGYDYHIVFVDDDSKDGTAQAVSTLEQNNPVKVILRKNERGLASAVVRGLKDVNSEFVIVMDADLQHPPEVLPEIMKALVTHELVVASRYCPGGSPGVWPITRRLISFTANLLALPLVPKVKDRMSGFFAFKRSAVETATLNAPGWKIGLEVMVRGHYDSVIEVPYTFVPRSHGSSKLSRRTIWQYLQQLVRLYMHKFKILNFMFVGGIGYVINLSLYSFLTLFPLLKTYQFDKFGMSYYLPPFVVSSLVAMVSNYLMNRIWTFKGWRERKASFARYMSMGIITLFLDIGFLWLLVDRGKLPPQPAAALAILIVFIVRYVIAKKWVWSEKPPKT
jgi:dolichol-phosphate mannosyltransferase